MVLIETLSHFILASNPTSNPTSKPQANLQANIQANIQANLQAKHDIYGNHEQASTNSTKQ